VPKSAVSKRATPSWTRHYHEIIYESDQPSRNSVISCRVHFTQSVCNHFTRLQLWLYQQLLILRYYEYVKLPPSRIAIYPPQSVSASSICSMYLYMMLTTCLDTSDVVNCKIFVAIQASSCCSAYVNPWSFLDAKLWSCDLAIFTWTHK